MRDYVLIGVKTMDDVVLEKPAYLSDSEERDLRFQYNHFGGKYEVIGQIASVPNWIVVRER